MTTGNKNKQRSQVEISLTSFTDFLLLAGMKKFKKGESILQQYQEAYQRHKDYYCEIRESIKAIHRQGRSVHELDQLPPTLPERNGKRTNCELMVRGYKRFWATSFQELDFNFKVPPKANWKYKRLSVRVNPELAFTDGADTFVIKLYLKKMKPSAEQAQLILHLMRLSLPFANERCVCCMVDVRRGRLIEEVAFDPRLTILLRSEAAAFLELASSLTESELNELAKEF